jgi:hypothetical protein
MSNSYRTTWRDSARPIVQEVLKQTKGQSEKEVRKALREAYPFGERKYWPYKVWCDEVKLQLGLKKQKRIEQPENQTDLFNG